MAISSYDFSYIMRKQFQKRVFIGISFVLILFTLYVSITTVLFFSVYQKNTSAKMELFFVTPLASPLESTNQKAGLLQKTLHSLPLERGNLVYIEPQYSKENSLPLKILNELIGFFTFQQYFPFSEHKEGKPPSIRRLVAFPEDTVFMRDFVLYIRPKGQDHFLTEFELSKHQYDIFISDLPPNWDTELGVYGTFEERVLKENEYFVLADNRTQFIDSRIWGAITPERIGGRVFLQFFPLKKFSFL